jgi:unsaturated chondroitin disaccharide hydrolase
VDTSAAVIAAAGLWTLGDRAAANRIVDAVITGHVDPTGVLAGGCYDLAGGVARAHELIWGTYFLTALVAIRAGRVRSPGW